MKRKRDHHHHPPPARQLVQRDPTLPILQRRSDVHAALAAHDVLIVVAETGSGKTTQLPQLILDQHRDARIVVTQPRRVAAMSVAARVAAERRSTLGEQVGYTVRFNDRSQRGITRIRYVTDGVLLREALLDGPHALRARYSHLVVDEVHERSVGTDVVLGLVRKMLASSPNAPPIAGAGTGAGAGAGLGGGILSKLPRSELQFKVVIMSATTDDRKLSEFFRATRPDLSIGVLRLPGRQHPIRTMYSTTQLDDYVHAAVETVLQIHSADAPGDILVFLAGMEDITSALAILADRARSLDRRRADALIALPLYAALPPDEQLRAIDPLPLAHHNPASSAPASASPSACASAAAAAAAATAPSGSAPARDGPLPRRKVVFATNVAETSITIPGVTFVVDCGVVKVRDVRADRGFVSDVLRVQAVSRAQAEQRAGRAGRTGPGTVYRLYTDEQYQKFTPFPKPELLRVETTGPALQIIALAGVAASRRRRMRRVQQQQEQQRKHQWDGDGAHADQKGKEGEEGKKKKKRKEEEEEEEEEEDIVTALEFIRFPLVDRVQRRSLERALETLVHLGALDRGTRLTPLGRVLARIPATPQLARALVESVRLGCSEAMTSVAAVLSVDGAVLVTPGQKAEQARAAHKRFVDGSGDHVTLVNVLNEYVVRERRDRAECATFCSEHFLNSRTLAAAAAVRKQLVAVLQRVDVDAWALQNQLPVEVAAEVAEAGMHELVRRALVAGFFRNIATRSAHDGRYVLLGQMGSGGDKDAGAGASTEAGAEAEADADGDSRTGGPSVDVHPSSALRALRKRRNPEAVVFDEVVLTSKVYMRTVTAIDLRWVRQHSTYYRRAAGGALG